VSNPALKEADVTQPGIDRPYRVIVWGPGHIGGTVLREVITRDDLELVGVKVYNEEKAGTDAGQLVGLPATGVLATADLNEILALDADVVLLTPRPMDRDQIDSDVVALLQSGKNVISTESHHFPRLGGVDYQQKFIDAGVAGDATLHGTGIHPSFFAERLGVTLTGLFTEIDHIHFSEAANVAGALHYPPEIIQMMGFNRDPVEFRADDPGAMLVDHYYRGVVAYMVHKLFGVEPEDVRIESDFEGIPTEKAIDQDGFIIEAGKSAVAVRTHRGYIGERLVYTNVEYWYWGLGCRYIGPENDVPFGPGDSNLDYVIDIAGRPGHIRLRLDVGDNTGDDIPVATWLSVTTLLQSIRPVVAAEPGILYHESSPNISDLRPSAALERVT
jgi:2,4-diaminopentanoate dehydrogenase